MSAVACLLCGFYIELGASVHRSIPALPREDLTLSDGYVVNYQPSRAYDINTTRNPYGVVATGFKFELSPKWSIDVALWRHESSMATGQDRGTDSHQLSVRWSPWARP